MALISTGFTLGTPFRVTMGDGEPAGADVGMKVAGGGNLVSTMQSVNAVVPQIIERLTSLGSAYPNSAYRTWLAALDKEQRTAGVTSADGVVEDPIAHMIEHGPRHMTDRVFIGFAGQDASPQILPVRIQVDEQV